MTMEPQDLIQCAAADGVRLTLADAETIAAAGDDRALKKWLPVLRPLKAELIEALRVLPQPAPEPDPAAAVEDALKDRAILVVLDGSGERVWLVADAEDAAKLGDVGGDSIITRSEIRILAAIEDPEVRAELMNFKRELRGTLTMEDRR